MSSFYSENYFEQAISSSELINDELTETENSEDTILDNNR